MNNYGINYRPETGTKKHVAKQFPFMSHSSQRGNKHCSPDRTKENRGKKGNPKHAVTFPNRHELPVFPGKFLFIDKKPFQDFLAQKLPKERK